MVSVIAWTCKSCAHHVEGLSVDEYMAVERAHTCKPEDELRRAARYWRRRSKPESAIGAVADWLERVAEGFTFCKPGERESALKVARATQWEADPR